MVERVRDSAARRPQRASVDGVVSIGGRTGSWGRRYGRRWGIWTDS
jgi:hypothetical protein